MKSADRYAFPFFEDLSMLTFMYFFLGFDNDKLFFVYAKDGFFVV